MSNSTTHLDLITTGQASKEVTANNAFNAASPALCYGMRVSTTTGLTWGFYGGTVIIAGTPTQIANGTVSLAASDTSYVYADNTGAVVDTTVEPSGWPGPLASDAVALYEIVTGASSITSYTDYRVTSGAPGPAGENWSVTINAQTGTTYTLQASDNGVVVTLSNASAITLTVPSGLGAAFSCELIQIGAGQVTVTGSGTTVNSWEGRTKLTGQHAAATLVAYAANVFNLAGNIST